MLNIVYSDGDGGAVRYIIKNICVVYVGDGNML